MIGELLEQISMGGYAFYVWTSVVVTVTVMTAYAVYTRRAERKMITHLNKALKRQDMRQKRYASHQKKETC